MTLFHVSDVLESPGCCKETWLAEKSFPTSNAPIHLTHSHGRFVMVDWTGWKQIKRHWLRASHKRHVESQYCKWTPHQTLGISYTCLEHHLTFEGIDARRQWSVLNLWWKDVVLFRDGYQWPVWSLAWGCIRRSYEALVYKGQKCFPWRFYSLNTVS